MKDMFGFIKQVQAFQEKMKDLQEEIQVETVEGSSGGGLVRLTMTTKGYIKNLQIDPSLLTKADASSIIEDLVIAAHEHARKKADDILAHKMQDISAALGLPSGMTPPFF